MVFKACVKISILLYSGWWAWMRVCVCVAEYSPVFFCM